MDHSAIREGLASAPVVVGLEVRWRTVEAVLLCKARPDELVVAFQRGQIGLAQLGRLFVDAARCECIPDTSVRQLLRRESMAVGLQSGAVARRMALRARVCGADRDLRSALCAVVLAIVEGNRRDQLRVGLAVGGDDVDPAVNDVLPQEQV